GAPQGFVKSLYMPNVGTILKDEITRLSKKVVRELVGPLQASASAQRKQLAALKKQVQEQQRELAQLRRAAERARPQAEPSEGKQHRVTAKGLITLRAKLGLSAEDFGLLAGVTGHTVYGWEKERGAPRPAQVEAIAALRSIGKREAQRRLEELRGAAGKKAP